MYQLAKGENFLVCQHVAQAHGFLLKGSFNYDITELGEFTKVQKH